MDASNRKDIRAAEKAAKLREESRRNFLVAAMTTPEGRAWFYDLLESCHLFSDPFSGVALTEAYLKGERNVGLKLFAEILACAPDSYILMIKEANYVRSTAAAERSREPNADGRDQGREPAPYEPDYFDEPDGAETQ